MRPRNRIWNAKLGFRVGLTILALIASSEARQSKPASRTEQSLFGAEDVAVDRPIGVPEGALQVLRKDEQILRYLEARGKSADELTTESFLASEIHLDGPDEIDLVVMGNDRLRGANVATFWVFRKLTNSFSLVLKTSAHDLRIQKTKWNHFRNIQTASPIAGEAYFAVYKFDGQQYKISERKSEPIK